MSEPKAMIRPYEQQDEKLVRFMVGKANMELLASANSSVYMNPMFLAVWLGLSSVFVQLAGWWPQENQEWWKYLRILPGLASVAVPLLFAVDWLHRQEFEGHARTVLRSPDLHDLAKYYSKSPASGVWILELGDTFVGLVAVDCSGEGDVSTIPEKTPSRSKSKAKTAGMKAVIRHFFVSELYRPTNIQDDLLKHAVEHAFSKDPKVIGIQATGYDTLIPYVEASLRRGGFKRDSIIKTMGLLRWKVSNYTLPRKQLSS